MRSNSIRALASLLALLMLLSCGLVACDKGNTPDNTTDTATEDTTKAPETDADTEDPTEGETEGETEPGTEADTEADTEDTTEVETEGGDEPAPEIQVITIAEALEICGEPGNITTERYYIRGIIQTIKNGSYGQMVIADETGSIDVYGTYSADGELTYTQLEYQPVKGDEVLLHCILQNYNGTKEVKNARLIEYKNNQADIDVSQYTEATLSEARDAETGANL